MDKWRRAFIVCLFLVAAFVPLFSFPADDGLRHVGAAFGDVKSWGDVYPFSVFEQFGDYDPWLGYDLALRIAARQIKTIPISATTLKYSLVKVLMLIFISAFLYLVVKRSGILEHVKDQASFTLAMIILLFFLFLPLRRVLTIRPFVFGTLYLLYSIGETGIVRGGISATILTFFYPYLSWFYIIPVAFSHFLKGDKRFAVGSIAFIVPYLVMQPFPFWGFQAALLNSEVTRRSIYTTSISEFAFSLSNSSFYMYLFAILTSYPFFSDKARRLNFLNLTLLIYLLAVQAWGDPDDPRRGITLRQLLRMESGLEFSESYGNPLGDVLWMLFGTGDAGGFAARKPLADLEARWGKGLFSGDRWIAVIWGAV